MKCLVLLIFTSFAVGQEPISLTVSPATPPTPALQHTFTTDLVDQIPGNAAILHLTAAHELARVRAQWPAESEKIAEWIAAPIDKLPKAETRRFLLWNQRVLELMKQASLRDRCDFDPPYRAEGYRTLIPYLQDARPLADIVALSARVNIAEGKFDGAIEDLRILFTQSRHLNELPFPIQSLVAAAIAQLALDQARDLIAQPNSPNLYWALGTLPAPWLDIRDGIQFERAGLYFSIPQLKEIRAGRLTRVEDWFEASQVWIDLQPAPQVARGDKVTLAFLAARDYPAAKQYLIDRKVPIAQVEAMPVQQVLAAFFVAQFEKWMQDIAKWHTLPYWQSIEGLVKLEAQLNTQRAMPAMQLASAFLPNTHRTYSRLVIVDRQVAILRALEAIRAHGRLPQSLDDLKDTPPPIDPMTGKPFIYKVSGDTARLEAPAIELAKPVETGIGYDIKFNK